MRRPILSAPPFSVALLVLGVLVIGCGGIGVLDTDDELAAAWAARVEQPDIILILVDTLRKDRLGLYGHDRNTTPNLDRLGRSAVVYENAFSHAPWTLPSVAAMLTSQYPSALGIRGFRRRIPDSAILMQEILSASGYSTHGIISHTFVGAKWGFDRGFDTFQSFAGGHRRVSSEVVTEAAIEIVDRLDEQPTFLMVHYFDPHFLFMEHEGFRFSGPPPDAESEWWNMPHRWLDVQANKGKFTEAWRDHLYDLYDSEIAFADFHIGRLLDRIESEGHLQDSVVIFTADHGEEFLDHQRFGHGTAVYNELINVPLVIKWPGVDEGVRSNRYVAHVDLLPTLLDYLGIPFAGELAGVPLRNRDSTRPIIAEHHRRRDLTTVIQDGLKLIEKERRQTREFYDLHTDPVEAQPLDRIDASEQLNAELKAFRDRLKAQSDGAQMGDEVEMDEEERRQLEALGYVD